jgi:hypothetical protein
MLVGTSYFGLSLLAVACAPFLSYDVPNVIRAVDDSQAGQCGRIRREVPQGTRKERNVAR